MKIDKRGKIAIFEINILIVSIFAFAFMVASFSEIKEVKGLEVGDKLVSETQRSGYITVDRIQGNNVYFKEGGEMALDKAEKMKIFKSPSVGGGTQPEGPSTAQNALGYQKGEGLTSYFTSTGPGLIRNVVQGAAWATAVYFLVKTIGGMVTDDEAKVNAAASALAGGIFAGKATYGLLTTESLKTTWLGQHAPGVSLAVGAVVAIAIFLLMYKKESQEVVYFECQPWDAPTGGDNCEKCNKQGILPCSEYQCRSLGQACELLNKGAENELCAWVNRKDVNPPVIIPWNEALLDGYSYKPDSTISPPDRGVKIVKRDSTTGCVKAFTPISFGITMDEPAKCKLDYSGKRTFEDMRFYFGGSSLFSYNHSQVLSLPGPGAINNESPIIQNDGNYGLYVRCMDANGNENTANFVFKFCVEKGPDTTPPLIITTSLINGMPVAYNQSSINVELYINEPADCKWSPRDQVYDKMENTMQCSSSVFEMNAQMLYKCKTTLTGLKNREENKFYFRCKDQPLKPEKDRNVNQESYAFSLMGSQPLYIDSVGPNETIKDSTDIIKVTLITETSAGYKDGEANCYYSDINEDEKYVLFYDTGTHKHSQELYLAEGDYKYYIKCIDLGGNADKKTVEFNVESDTQSPIAVRVYHEENYLKVITNEEAVCVYSKDSCNYVFDDGIKIAVVNKIQHFTDWNTNFNYYIKCKDSYGNQPLPNACNIIARPFDVYAGE